MQSAHQMLWILCVAGLLEACGGGGSDTPSTGPASTVLASSLGGHTSDQSTSQTSTSQAGSSESSASQSNIVTSSTGNVQSASSQSTLTQGSSGSSIQNTASQSTVSSSSFNTIPSSASSMTSSAISATCSDDDVQKVFSDNSCLFCHNAQNFANIGGGLNLESGNVGQNLLNLPTASTDVACSGELIIDANNPADSLLLKLIDSEALSALGQTGCVRQPMPTTANFMPADDYQCLTRWVAHVAATQTPIEAPPEPTVAFEPVTAAEAMAKTKYILHGSPVTNAELAGLGGPNATPAADDIEALITGWEASAQYEKKVKNFLALALQQTTDDRARYMDQFNNLFNSDAVIDSKQLVSNFREMFLRTAWNIVDEQKDFRDIITTRTWQVTTASLIGLIYLDKENQTPGRSYLRNPVSQDRMRAFAHLSEADYSDWRNITITQAIVPYDYENTAGFAQSIRDIPDGGSIGLLFPRVGFFNTPAFFELWPTNDDNQFRVTTQQTLITALDLTFDPADATVHMSEEGIPPEHIDPTTTCYQCHRLMDPMRLVFQNYQVSRNRAKTPDTNTPPEPLLQPAFAIKGVSTTMNTVDDFAALLAEHPRFATAWVQKLCMWANSQRCDETGTEFSRLAEYFEQQDFNFKKLLRAFFSSPLFNATQIVDTHQTQEFLVSMARGNHFCEAMDVRLAELKTINNTLGNTRLCDDDDNFGIIAPDLFDRGEGNFVQSTALKAFDAKSIDQTCGQSASKIFGYNDNKYINITTEEGAAEGLEQLVSVVMGLPSAHPRYASALKGIIEVYEIANHSTLCAEGVNPAAQVDVSCGYDLNRQFSMRAAWFAACTSPDIIAVGL